MCVLNFIRGGRLYIRLMKDRILLFELYIVGYFFLEYEVFIYYYKLRSVLYYEVYR